VNVRLLFLEKDLELTDGIALDLPYALGGNVKACSNVAKGNFLFQKVPRAQNFWCARIAEPQKKTLEKLALVAIENGRFPTEMLRTFVLHHITEFDAVFAVAAHCCV